MSKSASGMRRAGLTAAWVSVAAATAAFFLPWAKLDVRGARLTELASSVPGAEGRVSRVTLQIRRGTETVAGSLPSLDALPRQVSGARIPGLARQEGAQVMVALMELLTHTCQHATLKSDTVFLVPGVALLCGLLLTGWSDRPAVAGSVMVLCAAVAVAAGWKLLTLDSSRSVVAVTIGWGLWLSVGAYVGLAAAAALTGMSGRNRT